MSDMMKSIGMDAAQVGWINDPADWLDTNIQQVMVIFMSCCILSRHKSRDDLHDPVVISPLMTPHV